jgi:hypothetical protein
MAGHGSVAERRISSRVRNFTEPNPRPFKGAFAVSWATRKNAGLQFTFILLPLFYLCIRNDLNVHIVLQLHTMSGVKDAHFVAMPILYYSYTGCLV